MRLTAAAVALLVCSLAPCRPVHAQESARRPTGEQVARARRILEQARRDLREHYFDSTFRGLDLEARYRTADGALDTASSWASLTGIIARFMAALNDSHTWFDPPALVARVEYGWSMQPIGDSLYVTWVRPGSDAQRKGLAVGDRVASFDGLPLNRRTLWVLMYTYYLLSPRSAIRLVVQPPDSAERVVDVAARVTRGSPVVNLNDPSQRLIALNECVECTARPLHATLSIDSVLIWRLAAFLPGDIDNFQRVLGRARRHRALVLDLRDNGGGDERAMLRLIGAFFEREVSVGTLRTRRENRPLVARPADDPFRGSLVVLVNGSSGSAAEVTAQVLLAEERATVVGDRTAGAVMRGRYFAHNVGGVEQRINFGFAVTNADLIMADGTRLEGRGVSPHEVVLPTGRDLKLERDPQLAHALSLVGVTRTSEQAGAITRELTREN
jgi:C-terminal processing protease CtpA/Prc